MNKKVVMVTLAVCLILGVGILAVYAWAPGVNASADFDHPRWAVWTSEHRAKATFDASHAIAPFVIPHGHTHGIRGRKSMVPTTHHTLGT